MYVRDITDTNTFLDDFRLLKRAGRHGEFACKLAIAEDRIDELMNKLGQQIVVTPDKDSDTPIFKGIIVETGYKKGYAGIELSLKAMSLSIELDEEKHDRIFQNPEKKFGEILESPSWGKCRLKLADALKNLVYEPVILQFQETDFQFLKRMAATAGLPLWLDDMNLDPELHIASCVSSKEYALKQENIFSVVQRRSRPDARKVSLVSAEFINPGFLVAIPGVSRPYLVLSTRAKLCGGADVYTYELEEYREREPKPDPLPLLPPIKLTGNVADASDPDNLGRIRVNFSALEDKTPADKKLWLPFRPGYAGKNSGIIFIPDAGDQVEVFFVNGQVYCDTALREHALAEECRAVGNKAICNNNGQRIFWKEQSLELLSAENRIFMDKDKIELTVGENMLRITADDILLQTPKNVISMKADGLRCQTDGKFTNVVQGEWNVQASGSASLDAKSKLVFSAQSEARLKGMGVKIDASGGNVDISGTKINLS